MSINGLSVHSNLSPSSPSASAPASPPLPHAFHYPSPAPPYLPHPRLPDPSQQTLSSAVFSDSVQNYLLDSGPSGSQFLHSTPSSPTPLPPRSESSLVSRPVLPHENLLTSTPIDDQLSREFPEVANLRSVAISCLSGEVYLTPDDVTLLARRTFKICYKIQGTYVQFSFNFHK